MKKTRVLSFVLSVVLILCTLPVFSVSASEVLTINGERTALVSSFGKLNYEGKSYKTFKTFPEALTALGAEGGTIVFTGKILLPEFSDVKSRGPITVKGTGSNPVGNLLDFTGSGNIELCGDLSLEFLNLRLDKDAYVVTNGHSFDTLNNFDTYHTEKHQEGTSNIINYPDPPSIAVGSSESATGKISINKGYFTTLAAGTSDGMTYNGTTILSLGGGTVTNVVGGNIGNGTLNGDAKLTVGEGFITKLVAGSSAGTVNGNVSVTLGGGEIKEAVIGAEQGAAINGNVIVTLNGGNYSGSIKKGSGTVSGKIVVITGEKTVAEIESGAADVIIKLTGGFCTPVFNGQTITGYSFTDQYGIPAEAIILNGEKFTSENGVFNIPDGESTVSVESSFGIEIKRNAKYVSGYEDGTFLPQNNITRAEAITLLTRVIADETKIKGVIKADYTDVQNGAWYESYIGLFQSLGFLDTIAERGGAEIRPAQNITRGEFSELIYHINNIDGTPASVKLKEFSDVDGTYPYVKAIYSAVDAGIVTGYEDNTFKPDNNITRAEAVTMVNRLLGRVPNGAEAQAAFSDIGTHWAKGQILAACGDENATWTAASEEAKYQIKGTKAEDYIKALYEQAPSLSGTAIREGADTIAEQMKKDILNTPNTMEIYADKIKGAVYYISEKNGNDANDGKSPETAWKTFEGIKANVTLPRNATFLFERGGIYRGVAPVFNHCIYGSYGEGPKPLFMQSKKNYADPSLWEQTEWKNVWKLKEQLVNVGIIGFDHDLFDYSDATYDELYGLIMNKDTRGFDGPQELCGDLQFYSVIPNGNFTAPGDLFLYSTEGNPGERFSSIEIGERFNIFSGATMNVTVDNIAVKFTGAHGVGYSTCTAMTVTNCIFSWLGGSALYFGKDGKSIVNYGNAVQVYGGCNGYYVKNNWMYQIYDTAVTHQRSASTGDCIQKDIEYSSNLMEYVFWGIEFYNAPPTAEQLKGKPDTYKRMTEDVYSAYNLLRLGGYGWGSVVRYRTSQLYCGASGMSENKNCLTEYNIFDRATGNLLNLPAVMKEVDDKNIYIQTLGKNIGSLKGTVKSCTYDMAKDISKYWGDKNAVVVVIDPEKEPVIVKKPVGLAPAQLN